MTIRKLYGATDSISTMRALVSLFEHDVEFEFIVVDCESGEHTKPSFLALSPFGQVPVYQEDDLIIFEQLYGVNNVKTYPPESRAIIRTISHLYPKTHKEQVYMDPILQGIAATWIDVENHQFSPLALRIITELIFNPKNNDPPADASAVAQAESELAKVLDVYEERLKGSKYLGGDKFTSADLTHLPCLYYLTKTRAKRLLEERIHVSKWCHNILSRPAWATVEKMIVTTV